MSHRISDCFNVPRHIFNESLGIVILVCIG